MSHPSLFAEGVAAGTLLALVFGSLAAVHWRDLKSAWHDVTRKIP